MVVKRQNNKKDASVTKKLLAFKDPSSNFPEVYNFYYALLFETSKKVRE